MNLLNENLSIFLFCKGVCFFEMNLNKLKRKWLIKITFVFNETFYLYQLMDIDTAVWKHYLVVRSVLSISIIKVEEALWQHWQPLLEAWPALGWLLRCGERHQDHAVLPIRCEWYLRLCLWHTHGHARLLEHLGLGSTAKINDGLVEAVSSGEGWLLKWRRLGSHVLGI